MLGKTLPSASIPDRDKLRVSEIRGYIVGVHNLMELYSLGDYISGPLFRKPPVQFART